MSFFYEIRSADNTVLKRDGGYPDREAATVAARAGGKAFEAGLPGRVAQPLNFRVAAPSWFLEGAEGLDYFFSDDLYIRASRPWPHRKAERSNHQ